jgi:hypothetical protein
MSEKPRKWWLVVAFFLSLWLCIIFAVSSIVVAVHTDAELYRYPACHYLRTPVWQYQDATQVIYPGFSNMSPKQRATNFYICIQLT